MSSFFGKLLSRSDVLEEAEKEEQGIVIIEINLYHSEEPSAALCSRHR